MSESPLPVVIVGGGPCGLITALLLARSGVNSVVLEKKPGLSTHPKAMGISRRSAEIYRQLGLTDRMREGSLVFDEQWLAIWSRTLVGEELGRTPLTASHSELTPCHSAHCPQTWTEQVLLEAVNAEPLAEVRFSTEVSRIEPQVDRVRAFLSSGESLEASWLVAADGAGSGVRHQLGVETAGPGDLGHFVNVMFRASYGKYLQDRQAVLYQSLTEEGFEAFVAVNGSDLWLMHHFLQKGETAEDFSAEKFEEIIRGMSGLPDEPVEVLSMSPWVMSPKVANKFRIGRVLLTGDAAARLSPAGGLGLNTGLQSAHNLAWKLAAVVRGDAGEALLDTYESERLGVAGRTLENTNKNAFEIFDVIQAGLKGEWDQAKDLIAHSRRGGAGLGQDLGVAYGGGAFVPDGTVAQEVADPVNEYIPEARPGHRAPHVPIEWMGRTASTLDLFGQDFRLLSGRDGAAWPGAMRNGVDFFAENFESAYGIEPSGAVLVRPDGYVGARFFSAPEDPIAAVQQARASILCHT
jgi:putative polyketide hydroxylase